MATDADAVYLDWNTPEARAFKTVSPDSLKQFDFATGSMGPKVEAACQFADSTGKSAAIGALGDLKGMVDGVAGTTVTATQEETVWH